MACYWAVMLEILMVDYLAELLVRCSAVLKVCCWVDWKVYSLVDHWVEMKDERMVATMVGQTVERMDYRLVVTLDYWWVVQMDELMVELTVVPLDKLSAEMMVDLWVAKTRWGNK
jgi:hypothetical protein